MFKADSWIAIKVDRAEFHNMNAALKEGCVAYTAKDDAVLKFNVGDTETSREIEKNSHIFVSGDIVHIQTAKRDRTMRTGDFPI